MVQKAKDVVPRMFVLDYNTAFHFLLIISYNYSVIFEHSPFL